MVDQKPHRGELALRAHVHCNRCGSHLPLRLRAGDRLRCLMGEPTALIDALTRHFERRFRAWTVSGSPEYFRANGLDRAVETKGRHLFYAVGMAMAGPFYGQAYALRVRRDFCVRFRATSKRYRIVPTFTGVRSMRLGRRVIGACVSHETPLNHEHLGFALKDARR